MQPKVLFQSPEEACKAVQREMGKITARPYNLHDPDASEWWLIPGSDWPAYHRGKVHFDCYDNPEEMFIAFYLEKKFGPSLGEVCPSNMVMGDNPAWIWGRFIMDFKKGVVPERLSKLARGSGRNPEILIKGEIGSPESNPFDNQDWPWYSLEWNESAQSYGLLDKESGRGKEPRLSDYSGVESHAEFLQRLEADSAKEWLWIDLFIGLTFSIKPKAKKAMLWDANKIREVLIRPFQDWIE